MILRDALRKRGLELHPSKCKAQTNCDRHVERGDVHIDRDFTLKVLAEVEPVEVLGTSLALQDVTAVEVEHRISCAWRKFWSMKQLLLNRGASVHRRLQLFVVTVGS